MALIPPSYLNTVACIGADQNDEGASWAASGFFYGDHVDGENGERKYRVYLVTNRHVLQDRERILVRLNPKGADPAVEFPVQLIRDDGSKIWFAPRQEDIDLALIHVDAPSLRQQGIKFDYFRSDLNVLLRSKAKEMGVMEGDGVYCLGFPLGLVGGDRNFVIVRQGAIARISDALVGSSNEFLLDMLIFPGNSGGPVIIRPEAVALEGTSKISSPFLIGVVKNYLSYRDTAVSTQTLRVRITFEENSGLASAIPIDFIKIAIDEYLAEHGADEVAA